MIFDRWPSMNICETEDSCIIVCEIAGMKEGDFQISIEGNRLYIGGERQEPKVIEKIIHHCYEIKYGSFGRDYWVPNVNSEGEQAIYRDGYLKIVVPLGEKEPLESIHWNPAAFHGDFQHLTERLNTLFIRFGVETDWPPANMFETEQNQVILCEIAGMKEDDFLIEVDDGRLIISGIRPEPSLSGRTTYHCMEIASGPFRREFPILRDVDTKSIRATYQDGFLMVTISKMKGSLSQMW